MTKSIKIRLLERGATAVSIQRRTGISEATWYERMRNPSSWRLGELNDVAAALGTSASELLRDV